MFLVSCGTPRDNPLLNVAAITFMLNSVAPSTSRQYSSHLKQYVDFCQLRNLTAFPLHQQNLVLFAAHLDKSLSHSGIQGHLADMLLFMGLATPIRFHHSIDYI